MKITKKTITNAILLLLSAGVFVLIALRTDWEKTISAIKSANLFWILVSTAAMLLSHWFRGARWTLLTTPAGYPLNKRRSFYSVMSGYLVNVATSRGGELVRCALTASSEKAPLELLIGTVVTERILDLLMMILVCLLALTLQFSYIYDFFNTLIFAKITGFLTTKNIAVIAILLLIAVSMYSIYRKRNKKQQVGQGIVARTLARFTDGLSSVFKLKRPFIFIGYTVGIWALYWAGTYCLLQSMEVTSHLTFLNAIGVLIFASIGIAIPLPAGAGVWGAVSLGLQSVYHISPNNADTYAIYNVAFSNLLMIGFGAMFYLFLFVEMRKMQKNDSK